MMCERDANPGLKAPKRSKNVSISMNAPKSNRHVSKSKSVEAVLVTEILPGHVLHIFEAAL